ncbi:hypothetical protein O181_114447 [Austropuccinia psidii MF-1]|uniref:Uncharacterized protein n=1 Tax=Austropuccinia psidii MF-1 TaxID=1389203 RepID=A0A9Q3PWD1_9BASI|nr:hypothetical protein [Austropuccinia psidii MF-1]
MSPKIPLTTPIESLINVSGLNIDVGNVTARTSTTWSRPNISVTPIPQKPTNTQIHVPEGPESTPEILSKVNTQSNFPCDFLLNHGENPEESQEPLGKSKKPSLNIPSGSQVHVGYEKQFDGGKEKDHWKILIRVVFQRLGKILRQSLAIYFMSSKCQAG